jgi:hypothetical protein
MNPTKHQRDILTMLADPKIENRLVDAHVGCPWITDGFIPTEFLLRKTFHIMREHGWLESITLSDDEIRWGYGDDHYTISADGRAAIGLSTAHPRRPSAEGQEVLGS